MSGLGAIGNVVAAATGVAGGVAACVVANQLTPDGASSEPGTILIGDLWKREVLPIVAGGVAASAVAGALLTTTPRLGALAPATTALAGGLLVGGVGTATLAVLGAGAAHGLVHVLAADRS